MGYLKSVGAGIIYIGVILAVLTFAPGFPPEANFTEYSIVPPKELEGPLAVNDRLNDAEILLQGKVNGPEAFSSYKGELYTGLNGGYVVKIKENGEMAPVIKFGKSCDGHWQEHICGRPLGMKFNKNGQLFVADGYYGIFKVDVDTGNYEQLVDSSKPIDGKAPMIPNFLDVASNGDIYWTDSSSEFHINDGVYSVLADPSGRLIRYNAKTKKNEVLVKNLALANGVHLSDDESFVIVAEVSASRIIKYNLKGPNAGKQEVFVEGLPGLPDNIHSDGRGGFLVSLFAYSDSQNPQLFQSLAPHPNIRKLLVRLMYLLEAPFKLVQTFYPNHCVEKIIHWIGHFTSAPFTGPKYATVLRIDANGKIIDAAYGTDGRVTSISSAHIENDYLYLGSPFNEYIARVPLKKAFPSLASSPPKATTTESAKKANEIPEEKKKPQKKVVEEKAKVKSEKSQKESKNKS